VYLGLFIYCALKSGSLPLIAGVAATLGALDPWLVVIASFLGGYLGDEARFYASRRYGVAWLERSERNRKWLLRSQALMERYGIAYMFVYRYPKGMRTIGALPVGLTNITWKQFTVLNMMSAALWAVMMVGAGFLFGEAIVNGVEQGWGLFSVALLFVFALAGWFAWRKLLRENLTK